MCMVACLWACVFVSLFVCAITQGCYLLLLVWVCCCATVELVLCWFGLVCGWCWDVLVVWVCVMIVCCCL